MNPLVRDILAWTIPLVVCYFAWPVLRRKRVYMVAAAILCLTPMLVHYKGMGSFITVWPLILSLPAYLMLLPQSLKGLLYMGLPSAVLIGCLAWFWSGRMLRAGGS
ncbi:MAG: hypothetical protein AAGF72_05910 [Pseudomonadota bacterium]